MRSDTVTRVIMICCGVFLVCSPASLATADAVGGALENGKAIITDAAGVRVIDDERLRKEFETKVTTLVGDSPDRFVEYRPAQLARRSCALELPVPGTLSMTPAEIYRQRIDSVVVVGIFYHCASKNCQCLHSSLSSGVVIHESGVLLTNYHVVEIAQPRLLAMAVMMADGRVFLVDEILAADPVHDVAAIKLRGASGLPAAPVFRDEPVGRPVTLITHPRNHFYSLTSGYVSRYSMGERTNVVMNITADYAVGSSGGAIFNDRGDVVGLVSSTTSIAAGNVRLDQGTKGGVLDKLFGRHHAGDPAAVVRCEAVDAPDEEHAPDGEVPPREEEKGPVRKGPSPPPRSRTVNIPVNHQMTIKNAVPSRAILDLFTK